MSYFLRVAVIPLCGFAAGYLLRKRLDRRGYARAIERRLAWKPGDRA